MHPLLCCKHSQPCVSCGGDLQPADLPLPLVRCHALFPATVAPFAPPRDEVKAAFRRAALACHPDVDKSPQAAARFTQVKAAADVLLKGVRAFWWWGAADRRTGVYRVPSRAGMHMPCCFSIVLLAHLRLLATWHTAPATAEAAII